MDVMDRNTLGIVTLVDIEVRTTRDLADVKPDWARGMLSSKAASSQEPLMESVQVTPKLDQQTGLQYFSVPGFHAVVVEPPNIGALNLAVELVQRLSAGSPLDVGMLALNDGVTLTAAWVNKLASSSVMVSRLRDNSATAKARREVERYLELRSQGQASLERFGWAPEREPAKWAEASA